MEDGGTGFFVSPLLSPNNWFAILQPVIILSCGDLKKVRSAGFAANLLELNRAEFDAVLFQHRISPFNYTAEKLAKEFEVVDDLASTLRVRRKKI